MTYSLIPSRRYIRTYKRIHPKQLFDVHEALKAIQAMPSIGVQKVGDLAGLMVHKFISGNQELLIAYTVNEERKEITLEALGPHENFYRDLKR